MNQLELASKLAKDEKFRKQAINAVAHATMIRRRTKLAAYEQLRAELRELTKNVQRAVTRAEKKRSHKFRNTILLAGAGGAVAAIPQARRFVLARFSSVPGMNGTMPRTIEESMDVNVPVSTAYNQWTQFEDFPLFMEGVDHVDQLGDTELHWVASIGGKRAEWDAKIVEQQPDTRIAWRSVDGRETHGTVWFEKLGEDRTLVRLAMTYRPQGPVELAGSAAGVDRRRIKGDLERFRDLIESRGTESGAWRGEVESGTKSG